MKVAALMSTYNGEKYIREQINSILEQQGDFKLDLWVRDDGSDDTTREILEEYAAGGHLRWYTGQNLGPARSFMDLVHRCEEYDYYAFADQDDYWNVDKVQTGIEMMKNIDVPSFYFSNAELVGAELNSLGRNVYRAKPKTDLYTLTCAGGVLGCTMILNHKLVQLLRNIENVQNVVMHDFYIAVVCAAVGGKICYDEKAHMKYRQHENNVIGVSYGFINTIKQRLSDILSKNKIGIAEQAEEILRLQGYDLMTDAEVWLKRVANYKKSVLTRIFLACSKKTKYINRNMGIKLRLSILLGNR